MDMLVCDPSVQERLKAERELFGSDRWDEVWEGTYVMNPLPNIQHQDLVGNLVAIIKEVLGWQSGGSVYPGVNVSDRVDGWEQNYRGPDVAVYLAGNAAVNCGAHWCGGPDLVMEIVSPGDRARDKIPFYEKVNTRELYILDRDPWTLEQFGLENGRLISLGRSTCDSPVVLSSRVLPVALRLISGTPRPHVEVVCLDDDRRWLA
jgi:Uma2 family endonuclease